MEGSRAGRCAPPQLATSSDSRFCPPVRACAVDRPSPGPGWLHEVNHDGFRILALKQDERVTVWSRRGADYY